MRATSRFRRRPRAQSKHFVRVGAFTAVVLGSLVACKDAPTRPTELEQATFTLTVGDRDWWPNDNPEKEYWLTADLTLRESAGLGGNIDFLRLEGKGPGGSFEKAEIGSDLVVARLGTNRVDASSTWSYQVGWEWNMQNTVGYKITVQLTDDKGHVTTLVSATRVIRNDSNWAPPPLRLRQADEAPPRGLRGAPSSAFR